MAASPCSRSLPDRPGEPRVLRMANPEVQFPPVFDLSGTRLALGLRGASPSRVGSGTSRARRTPSPSCFSGRTRPRRSRASSTTVGDWVVVVNHSSLAFWSQRQPHVRVLPGHAAAGQRVSCSPATGSGSSPAPTDAVRASAPRRGGGRGRGAWTAAATWCYDLAIAPDAGAGPERRAERRLPSPALRGSGSLALPEPRRGPGGGLRHRRLRPVRSDRDRAYTGPVVTEGPARVGPRARWGSAFCPSSPPGRGAWASTGAWGT